MSAFDDLTITPCDMYRLSSGNLYKNILICLKRARQIELERYEDLNGKLKDWIEYAGELSFDGLYNVDAQNEISQYFENLKKPELTAIEEFEDSELNVEDFPYDNLSDSSLSISTKASTNSSHTALGSHSKLLPKSQAA